MGPVKGLEKGSKVVSVTAVVITDGRQLLVPIGASGPASCSIRKFSDDYTPRTNCYFSSISSTTMICWLWYCCIEEDGNLLLLLSVRRRSYQFNTAFNKGREHFCLLEWNAGSIFFSLAPWSEVARPKKYWYDYSIPRLAQNTKVNKGLWQCDNLRVNLTVWHIDCLTIAGQIVMQVYSPVFQKLVPFHPVLLLVISFETLVKFFNGGNVLP